MAITKKLLQIEFRYYIIQIWRENPVVLVSVREKTSIVEDGVEISSSFHRYMIGSLDDYSSRPAQVRSV